METKKKRGPGVGKLGEGIVGWKQSPSNKGWEVGVGVGLEMRRAIPTKGELVRS